MTSSSKAKQHRFWRRWAAAGAIGTISTVLRPSRIPSITTRELKNRMWRIKYVLPAMVGTDGKPYQTEEKDPKYFDLFYVHSKVHPRKQAFNFDENKILTEKATGLIPIARKSILVKVGGYYGFCKISMAEVMSQIPNDILKNVVAFTLDPEFDITFQDDDYQIVPMIFYGKTEDISSPNEDLPSIKDLIRPTDTDKAARLKNQLRPMLNWQNEGYKFTDPGDIEKPFLYIGIWLRINGSNLHKYNAQDPATEPVKLGKTISIYRPFTNGADYFAPTYADTISQVPDELITEKTVGLLYRFTDYFKTKEGVVHKSEYVLVERA